MKNFNPFLPAVLLIGTSASATTNYITSPIPIIENLIQKSQDGTIEGDAGNGSPCFLKVIKTTPLFYYYYNFTVSRVPFIEANDQNSERAELWQEQEITRYTDNIFEFQNTNFDQYSTLSLWTFSVENGRVKSLSVKLRSLFSAKSYICNL